MYLLIVFAVLIVAAFACAGFTDLYSFALGDPATEKEPREGRALSWLGIWLNDRFEAFQLVTREVKASKMRLATTLKEAKRAKRWDRVNPYKLLGMCPRCVNAWVSAAGFVGVHFVAASFCLPITWWLLPVFIGISNVALSLVEKLR